MDDYSITLPVSDEFSSNSGMLIVEEVSGKIFRDKLEVFARYFKKEFGFDFVQYEASEHLLSNNKYEGFLFTELAWDHLEEDKPTPYRLYGGGCMRWRKFHDKEASWVLDWVWLHPFFRHRGEFQKHWNYLKTQYGDFAIEPPISADMQKFLEKNT